LAGYGGEGKIWLGIMFRDAFYGVFFYNSKILLELEGSTRCTKNRTAQRQKNKTGKLKKDYQKLLSANTNVWFLKPFIK
jgi:hypothetical protein